MSAGIACHISCDIILLLFIIASDWPRYQHCTKPNQFPYFPWNFENKLSSTQQAENKREQEMKVGLT